MAGLADRLRDRETLVPLVRYLTVGVVSNLLLYATYVGITWAGMAPLVATSLVYAVGVTGTYFANRGWSFQSDRSHGEAAPRYVAAYGLGYVVQFATLWAWTTFSTFPHQLGQLVAMGAATVTIFAGLRLWVFPVTAKTSSEEEA